MTRTATTRVDPPAAPPNAPDPRLNIGNLAESVARQATTIGQMAREGDDPGVMMPALEYDFEVLRQWVAGL